MVAGDDTIILGATYGTTDTLDGGGGHNLLGLTSAMTGPTTAAKTNVTNFQGLRVSDALAVAITSTHWGTLDTVTLDAGSNGG